MWTDVEAGAGRAGQVTGTDMETQACGRRAYERIPAAFAVRLEGTCGDVDARTVNLSRSGVLLEIVDRRFSPLPGSDPLVHGYRAIQRHFLGGARIHLPGVDEAIGAMPVRVAEEPSDSPLIAFQFDEPLPESVWLALSGEVTS